MITFLNDMTVLTSGVPGWWVFNPLFWLGLWPVALLLLGVCLVIAARHRRNEREKVLKARYWRYAS
jgi:cytochrome c-type biogenesis protein CcmH/NrfF